LDLCHITVGRGRMLTMLTVKRSPAPRLSSESTRSRKHVYHRRMEQQKQHVNRNDRRKRLGTRSRLHTCAMATNETRWRRPRPASVRRLFGDPGGGLTVLIVIRPCHRNSCIVIGSGCIHTDTRPNAGAIAGEICVRGRHAVYHALGSWDGYVVDKCRWSTDKAPRSFLPQ
jgi:hypothetical protein